MYGFKLEELYYQPHVFAKKIKLSLKSKNEWGKYIATNPQTGQRIEVHIGMTIGFIYDNGKEKEFLRVAEYRNGSEKIMMGGLPILGDIIDKETEHLNYGWQAQILNVAEYQAILLVALPLPKEKNFD